jgi:hypothetical protein
VRRALPWLVAAVIGLLGLPLIVAWLPERLADTAGLERPAAVEEIGRIRTGLLAGIAGLVAAFSACYTARSYALSKTGQVTDRFMRAVDQLTSGSDALTAVGAIYALEQIAGESPRHHRAVTEILTACVRARSPREFEVDPAQAEAPSQDVRTAMTALARLPSSADLRLDLSRVSLPDLRLPEEGGLTQANMYGTVLRSAWLDGVVFDGANLNSAELFGAHLNGASLVGCGLRGADLTAAELEGADLREADLTHAKLARARLRGADLTGAETAQAIGMDEADTERAAGLEA